MAYTYTWTTAIPAGSADPGTIDDQIRRLRAEIEERMDTITAADSKWSTSSPSQDIGLELGATSALTGVEVYFGHEILQPHTDDDDVEYNELYFRMDNNDTWTYQGHLALPVGSTLTGFEAIVDLQGTTSIDIALKYRTFTVAPSVSQISSVNVTAAGIQREDVYGPGESPGHEVQINRMYYVLLTKNGGIGYPRVYGFKATINVTDLSDYIG